MEVELDVLKEVWSGGQEGGAEEWKGQWKGQWGGLDADHTLARLQFSVKKIDKHAFLSCPDSTPRERANNASHRGRRKRERTNNASRTDGSTSTI